MKQILIFILGVGVGYLAAKWNKKDAKQEPEREKENLIQKQARDKAENKQKILDLLETQGKLTNNQVEQTIGISDATATRYLEELEKEGKVKQVGVTGKDVFYERI
jgi:predicted HTH transcriptional regulator